MFILMLLIKQSSVNVSRETHHPNGIICKVQWMNCLLWLLSIHLWFPVFVFVTKEWKAWRSETVSQKHCTKWREINWTMLIIFKGKGQDTGELKFLVWHTVDEISKQGCHGGLRNSTASVRVWSCPVEIKPKRTKTRIFFFLKKGDTLSIF